MVLPDQNPLTLDEALAVLAELERRAELARRSFIDENFPEQAGFVRSRATFKAALCTRRAGKSYADGIWLLEPVLKEPNVTTMFISLTRDSAKRIMWRDVLKEINEKEQLGFIPNETDLTLTNPSNKSMIAVVGADSGPHEMKKFLGSKLRRAAIDEAADFRQDLEALVYEILFPALADLDGEIALTGTPGTVCKGLFYEVTRAEKHLRRPGWDVHEWTALQNPHVAAKILKQIEELERQNPRVRETPWFRRMYLKEWVPEISSLVYRYKRGFNDLDVLPPGPFTNVLAIDLGFNDETTFVVGGYREHDKALYFHDYHEESGLDFSAVAERIRYYQRTHNPFAIVIDGANKQGVEEMKRRHSLPLESAEKHGKAEFISLMNSDFISQLIYLVGPALEPLRGEYDEHIWDEKELPKKVEHPASKNHGADGALYGWRKAYNYLAAARSEPKSKGESVDEWEIRKAQELLKKRDVLRTESLADRIAGSSINLADGELYNGNPFKSRRSIFSR